MPRGGSKSRNMAVLSIILIKTLKNNGGGKMKLKRQPKEKKKGTPKENNRHAFGNGHGKFGSKADRIRRMEGRSHGIPGAVPRAE